MDSDSGSASSHEEAGVNQQVVEPTAELVVSPNQTAYQHDVKAADLGRKNDKVRSSGRRGERVHHTSQLKSGREEQTAARHSHREKLEQKFHPFVTVQYESKDSPQYQAYQWLMNDPNLEDYRGLWRETKDSKIFSCHAVLCDQWRRLDRQQWLVGWIMRHMNVTGLPFPAPLGGNHGGTSERHYENLELGGFNLEGRLPPEIFFFDQSESRFAIGICTSATRKLQECFTDFSSLSCELNTSTGRQLTCRETKCPVQPILIGILTLPTELDIMSALENLRLELAH